MRVELLSFMITGVMDHRVLGNRSRSYLAMEQLEEALRDAELCCKLRPSWAKVKTEVGDYSLTPRHLPPPVFNMPIQRGRPSDSVCMCAMTLGQMVYCCTPHYLHSGLLLPPQYKEEGNLVMLGETENRHKRFYDILLEAERHTQISKALPFRT